MCSQSQSATSVEPLVTTSLLPQQNIHSNHTLPANLTRGLSSIDAFNNGVESDLVGRVVSSSNSLSDIGSVLSPPPTATSSSCINPFSSPGVNYDWLSPPKTISPPANEKRNTRGSTLSPLASNSVDKKGLSSCRYQQGLMNLPTVGGNTDNVVSLFNSGFGNDTAVLSRVASNIVESTTNLLQHHHLSFGNGNNAVYNSHFTPTTAPTGSVGSAVAAVAAAVAGGPSYHLPGHGLPSPTIYPPTPPPSAPWIHPWYTGDTF